MSNEDRYDLRFHASHVDEALDHLRDVVRRLERTTAELREAVASARVLKAKWREVAGALGVRTQSAQERFGGRARDEVVRAWDAIEREMEKLAVVRGLQVGPLEMLEQLKESGEVDQATADDALKLFTARDRSVHDSSFTLTEETADEMTDVAVHLRPTLLLLNGSLDGDW